jgi:hypothetical protein
MDFHGKSNYHQNLQKILTHIRERRFFFGCYN